MAGTYSQFYHSSLACQHLLWPVVLQKRSTIKHNKRLRQVISQSILEITSCSNRNKIEDVDRLSPRNRWSKWADQQNHNPSLEIPCNQESEGLGTGPSLSAIWPDKHSQSIDRLYALSITYGIISTVTTSITTFQQQHGGGAEGQRHNVVCIQRCKWS